MSLFIEVHDVDKGCQVIINMDSVMEIAPLIKIVNGKTMDNGCEVAFPDAAAVGGRRAMKVSNNYMEFKQFVMQTVSAADIAKVTERTKTTKEKAPVGDVLGNIPKL
jgi:hypothetical protein